MTRIVINYTTGMMQTYDCVSDPEQIYTFMVLLLVGGKKFYINKDSISTMELEHIFPHKMRYSNG